MPSLFRPYLSMSCPKMAAVAFVFLVASNINVQIQHRGATQCTGFSFDRRRPRPLKHRDPIWTMTQSQLRQRAREYKLFHRSIVEIQTQSVMRLLKKNHTQDEEEEYWSRMAKLQTESLDAAFGGGVTLTGRMTFMEKYGCAGFTNEVLDCILEQKQAGIVEMGAGHGQWARALSNRYNARQPQSSKEKGYEVVLAYDNMSQLPLGLDVHLSMTKVARDYFGTVRPLLGADALKFTLQQPQCRGRTLLLVFPPASDMAAQCAQAYANVPQDEHTILYVGEGRGGSTANDAFFDYIESSSWLLCQVLDVKRCGKNGLEKLYVLKKIKADQME